MMDVEEDNEKELHVLRSAVLASMKAKLKQKEKASKCGSPLGEDDIEHDPELAALRTVALMSKKEREEQAKKAAELRRQQQYQFQQGRGFQSNLIMIKTVDLTKKKESSPSNTGTNSQDNKKVAGKFSRYENSDSEEEEEEEIVNKSSSGSEPEASDAEEQDANQSTDSNKENREDGKDSGGSTGQSGSESDSSSGTSGSSTSSSASSSDSEDEGSSSSEEEEGVKGQTKVKEEVKKEAKEVKEEKRQERSQNAERMHGNGKEEKQASEGRVTLENIHKSNKVFSDKMNSDSKNSRDYVSSRNGDRLRSDRTTSSALSSNERRTDRKERESVKPVKSKSQHRDREQPIKDSSNREYGGREDRKNNQRQSRERKYESSRGSRTRDSKGRNDIESRFKGGESRGGSGGSSRERVRTGDPGRKRDGERDRSDRSQRDRHNRREGGSSGTTSKSRDRTSNSVTNITGKSSATGNIKEKDSVHQKTGSKPDYPQLRRVPDKKQLSAGNVKTRTPNKNSTSSEKTKSNWSTKLVHSSDSSSSESEVGSSEDGDTGSSDSDSDSDGGGRSKHRKSERNTEDIERERRLRRIAAREKKEAQKVQEVEVKREREERHHHRKDREVVGDNRGRSKPDAYKTERRSQVKTDRRDVKQVKGSPVRKRVDKVGIVKVKEEKTQNRSVEAQETLSKKSENRNLSQTSETLNKKVLSQVDSKSNKGDRLKPPPALMSIKVEKAPLTEAKQSRDKSPIAVKDTKKADLLKEIQRIDKKLAAKRLAGVKDGGEKTDRKKEVAVIRSEKTDSPPKSNKLKRKEVDGSPARDDLHPDLHPNQKPAGKHKRVKRSTSPIVSINFDKDPSGVDETKPPPSKKSVHERLGNIVSEIPSTLTKPMNKPNRRVVSIDSEDSRGADLRNLLHKRKTIITNDPLLDQEDIPVTSKQDFSGRKVMIYEDNMFETAPKKRTSSSKRVVSEVVSVVTKPRRDPRKYSADEKDRGKERRGERHEAKRGVTIKRPQLDKDPSYECELDNRIKQIKEKNAAILKRQRQIEEEKRKFAA